MVKGELDERGHRGTEKWGKEVKTGEKCNRGKKEKNGERRKEKSN